MLSGKQAFAGEDVSHTLAAVIMKEPDWSALPGNLRASVGRLLRRCLTKDLRSRLQAIGEARIAIEELIAHPESAQEVAVQPTTVPQALSLRRRALPWALLAVGLFLGAVGAGIIAWHLRPVPSPMRLSAELPPGLIIDRFRGAQLAISPAGMRIVVSESGTVGKWRLAMRSLDQSQFVALAGTERGLMPFFFSRWRMDWLLCAWQAQEDRSPRRRARDVMRRAQPQRSELG
jgi:eukaryotic-like serine/threonine-protein kinase